MEGFPKTCAAAREILATGGDALAEAQIVRLVCGDCAFYKEGEDEELECGAFRLLARLLRTGTLTVRGLLAALECGEPPRNAPGTGS